MPWQASRAGPPGRSTGDPTGCLSEPLGETESVCWFKSLVPLVHIDTLLLRQLVELSLFLPLIFLSPLSSLSPPSPMLDSVHQKQCNSDQLAEDFQVAFRGCELADVAFIVGDSHTPLYAVKAILACRSRSALSSLYETSTYFTR